MKPSIVVVSLVCLLPAAAHAQDGTPKGATPPAQAGAPATPGVPNTDTRAFPAETQLPEPTPPDQLKAGTLVLPKDAIEPYLLTKDNGPFMVLAKTFKGPDAERYALALVLELRKDFGLPAYILRLKDVPNRSNIRNVPPMAPEFVRQAQLTKPEADRSHDEASVLVGNEKTLEGSERLWKHVKKLNPVCLNEVPNPLHWRKGLSQATRTTNPYVPTQNIFPGKIKDKLVTKMNGGPRSIINCPGRYTLQVAEFGGRAMFNPSVADPRLLDSLWLKQSPLITAADDAEKLADLLAKDPGVKQSGFQPYVYHDRTSSKVMVGSFNDPSDPNAVRLRDNMIKLAAPLSAYKKVFVIAPATTLTDLEDPNQPIKTLAK